MLNLRSMFDDGILPREGGFTPATRTAKGTLDPDTLYGIVAKNWTHTLTTLPETTVAALPPAIHARVEAIRHAPPHDRAAATAELLHYVGHMLKPIGHAPHPAQGVPLHTTALPLPNLNATQQGELAAMQQIAFRIYEKQYVVDQGFDKYPEFIAPKIIDCGINSGPPRARWALVKALAETHAISDAEYHSFPTITSTQANDPGMFTLGDRHHKPGAGAAYGTPELNDRLLAFTHRLSPSQQHAVTERYDVWRMTYMKSLIADHPNEARFEEGWRNRIFHPEKFAAGPHTAQTALAPDMEQALTHSVHAHTVLPHGTTTHRLPDLALSVEYRDNGIGRAIAIAIPGQVSPVMYDIQADGSVSLKNGSVHFLHPLPEEIKELYPGIQVDSGPGSLINPYPFNHTLTWSDEQGHRRYLPLTQEMNNAIRTAGTTYIDHHLGLARVAFDANPNLPADADKLHVTQGMHAFAVEDVDKRQPIPAPQRFASPAETARATSRGPEGRNA